MDQTLEDVVTEYLKEGVHFLFSIYDQIPGHTLITSYIKKSYQNDPFRIVLECLLLFFAIYYILSKRYKLGNDMIPLTEREIDDLVEEWTPENLVGDSVDDNSATIKSTLNFPLVSTQDQKSLLNASSYNFLGMLGDSEVKVKAKEALRKYGVGSCGPPGFYGTLDVHLELEKSLAAFLRTESAIIYAQGFSTISSVIPAFSKRGDIIICDDGVSFAIQKGVKISRSNTYYYKHNSMEDLERILLQIESNKKGPSKHVHRQFIVTEGLFVNSGQIVPLPRLIELKKRFKYRLILDESCSFGSLGSRGAGVTDFYGINPSEVDIIVSSLSNSLASAGGFCAGTKEIVDHQRLSGQAYCFSASLPALLAVGAKISLDKIESNSECISKLNQNIRVFRDLLRKFSHPFLEFVGHLQSPILHLRFKKNERLGNISEEKRILDTVIDELMKNGLLLSTAKYVEGQELKPIYPSIRLCLSSAFNEQDVNSIFSILKNTLSAEHLMA